MSTLTHRVTATAVSALLGCLLGVGVVTALLLHVRAQRSLDQSLLAAAYAEAHPWQDRRFANDHVRSPVQVRPWAEGDPRVPAFMHEEAMRGELPLWRTLGDHRVLLLVVEPVEERPTREEDHDHLVIVADAPAVTLADAVIPFVSVYLLVSGLAAVLAAVLVRWGMGRALAPLSEAAAQLLRVQGLGSGARLEPAEVEEVDELIGSANALLDRLDRAFDAQANFTAQAAHELRTPVTVLKGELQLALRRERSSEGYRDTLKRTLKQVEQLGDLVEALMALARVEAGQADRGRAPEHVSMVVLRAMEQERSRLEAAGCAVQQDLSFDPELCMHIGLVTTALGNLLRNVAVHAPGATAWVRAEPGDGVVRLLVDDNGPGVAMEERELALERFGQGGGHGLGLGLGLALVREVARRHGGDLCLEDAPQGGLRAVITIATSEEA